MRWLVWKLGRRKFGKRSERSRRYGKISLPSLGDVTAAGKRVIDRQRELVRRYEDQRHSPEVLGTLENSPATVIISGCVTYPGKGTFARPTTVYQAIMQSGGV